MNVLGIRRLATTSGLIAVVLANGCQRANDFVEVTGRVTWNGKPIPTGMVVLQPTEPRQPPAGGKIDEGKFVLQTKPGKMRVQVEAVRATQQRDPQTGTALGEMYIPSRYNRETELKIDVTREGKNDFEFALKD